ncbi:MAG: 1-deoxy-D-xylulose-5-phosphate synthase [Proteobacteria bacterium]|nr:1-deoxy-D-xylulose-5-phosphate synthase [Pseudomonadota bacterium]
MEGKKDQSSLLDKISAPRDLRELTLSELPTASDQLRNFLVQSVAETGGHLSSNLGTVELTVALHYVFNTPHDRLVWDVGHQTYVHKILTGRKEGMSSLRKTGGMAGFPRREESSYDTFGTAHSSTSISAALGMAVASKIAGDDRRVVAIIGDGAMTAGMAFEGLNNAGMNDVNLLVILNDNDMSISENVGALNNYLARILSGGMYSAARKASGKVLERVPSMLELARRAEEHVKGMVMPGTLFEEFGFNYIGPIDGHDVRGLVKTLQNLRKLEGPQFLHVVTKKGKGYAPAEDNPIKYHGVSKFDHSKGIPPATINHKKTYSQVFGDWICEMAKEDDQLVAVTPAMREGSGLVRFSKEYPKRYFDVGIAEQHAITFAGGMACEGYKPVVAIYSTFLQRGYDQLIHDICIQKLSVTLAIDRAGLVGADGPTHHGAFDISFLRCIPNLTIMAPSDESETRNMLYTAHLNPGPSAVRYPRGYGPGEDTSRAMSELSIGKGKIKKSGAEIAILSFGSALQNAMLVAENLACTVADMRFVKPIDEDLVLNLSKSHELLVTIEENVVLGGAGSGVAEVLAKFGMKTPLLQLGLPDYFIEHGSSETLLKQCGLDGAGIEKSINAFREKVT